MRNWKYLLLLLLICCNRLSAQVIPSGKNVQTYFVYISGVNSKDDVRTIEKMIAGKPGVLYFMANDFPVRNFLLKTSAPISKTDFQQWLGAPYSIEFYGGENDIERERYLTKKIKAKQQP